MADFGLAKESVRGLGPGAYLVNVLPSAILVLGILALVDSRLYPWASPALNAKGQPIPAGPASIVAAADGLHVTGAVLLALTTLITSVVLRPFQISMVQMLEGYWRDRVLLAPAKVFAIERHVRRRTLNAARMLRLLELTVPPELQAVAAQARREHRADRRVDEADATVRQYPDEISMIMPTLLGNLLRKAETTAGERYGLDTVLTYPRLYPYLSSELRQEIITQLNLIDTSSALTVVLAALGALATPLIARLDGWSLVPLALAVISIVTYHGAILAAQRHATTLSSAFDLHRFDMITSMHRRLPADAHEEQADNQDLCRVLDGEKASEIEHGRWKYVHPDVASAPERRRIHAAGPDGPSDSAPSA